ncbi:MAG: hypothetical protein QM713_17650 [Arachnia sp.]
MRHDVTFHPVKPMFSPALEFVRKGEVHMLETGLLAEGLLLLVKIPFIGGFYSQMLSERTSRTVPYSQVVGHRFSGQWISIDFIKILFLLLLFVMLALAILTMVGSPSGFIPGLIATGLQLNDITQTTQARYAEWERNPPWPSTDPSHMGSIETFTVKEWRHEEMIPRAADVHRGGERFSRYALKAGEADRPQTPLDLQEACQPRRGRRVRRAVQVRTVLSEGSDRPAGRFVGELTSDRRIG